MSIRDQIASLEELATIDVDVRRIEEEIGKQRGSLEGMRAEVRELEARLRSDREKLSLMEKTRGELNVELRQMTQQIDKSREKLQRSRNERETNAAQREIEELRKLHRDREEEIEQLNKVVEEVKKSIDGDEGKLRTVVQAMEGSEKGTIRQLEDLEVARAARYKEREVAVKKLPTILYRRYENIRTRRPYAISSTHDGTCSGCHMTLPPMMFSKIRRQEEFTQCPSCQRILYYSPAPVRSAEGGAEEGQGSATPSSSSRA